MNAAADPFAEVIDLIQGGEPQSVEHRRAGKLIKKRLAEEPQCLWALAALAELQFRLAAPGGPITLEMAAATATRAIAAQSGIATASTRVGLNVGAAGWPAAPGLQPADGDTELALRDRPASQPGTSQSAWPQSALPQSATPQSATPQSGALQPGARLSGAVQSGAPHLGAPFLTLAKVQLEHGRPADAMAWVHRALKHPCIKSDVLFVLARIAQQERRWVEAATSYRHCLDQTTNPLRRSNVLCWLAEVLLQSQPPEVAAARQAMEQALALTPASLVKLLQHAELLLSHTQDYEAALKAARRLVRQSEGAHGNELAALAQYGLWAHRLASNQLLLDLGGNAQPQRGLLGGLSVADAMVQASRRPAAGLIVEALLLSGQINNVNYIEPTLGHGALVGAAIANNLPLARLLVARGASVHGQERATGRNALFWFAVHGNVEAVRWLHARGSDPHMLDTGGRTVVAAARQAARSEDQKAAADIIALLCENKS